MLDERNTKKKQIKIAKIDQEESYTLYDDDNDSGEVDVGAGSLLKRLLLSWVPRMERDLMQNQRSVKLGHFYDLPIAERALRTEINQLESFQAGVKSFIIGKSQFLILILVLCCAVSLMPCFAFKFLFVGYMDDPQVIDPQEEHPRFQAKN